MPAEPRLRYHHEDFISGIFWLIIGVGLSFWSTAYKIGTITKPGSGFLPLVLGLIIIISSIILIVKTGKSSAVGKGLSLSLTEGKKKVLLTVATLLLTIVLFERIGYLPSLFLFMLSLLRVVGLKSWNLVLLFALFTILGVQVVFVLLLHQPLPLSFLGI